jgi:hypothetical protein
MNQRKAIRIVNSKNFIWMEGMLAYIPVEDEWHPIRLTPPLVDNWNSKQIKNCLPDIDDPATIGCLLVLAGEEIDLDKIEEMLEPESDMIA